MLFFQRKFQKKTSYGDLFTDHPLCLSSSFRALFSEPVHVSACYDRIEKYFFSNIKTALAYIFAFTNYGDKMNLSLSEADSC